MMNEENIKNTYQEYEVTGEYAGLRLDAFLSEIYSDRSRNYFQKLIQSDKISVNGDKSLKKSYSLSVGDIVGIEIPEAEKLDIAPQNIPLDILYEDEDLIVINKPKGMVVHPAPGHFDGTLVNAVLFHCKDNLSGINGKIRPGIVHRLDKNTTGAIIVCKNDKSHESISAQLKEHTARRIYKGIVTGRLGEEDFVIDKPIGRSRRDRKKMAVVADGKKAVTHIRLIRQFDKYAFCEFALETGRTHQIRVHMASIGRPLMGDDVYGKANVKTQGQVLHAEHIIFRHPETNEEMNIEAPLPTYFTEILEKLEKTC